MSPQAQTKKPAQIAANDGGVPHTARRAPQQQQGAMSPVLRLIQHQPDRGTEAHQKQQREGKTCL